MVQGAGNLYKHVGIKVQLKKIQDKKTKTKNGNEAIMVVEHSIHYPKENQCDNDQEFAYEVQQAMDAGRSLIMAIYYLCKSEFSTVEKYHSCGEYEQRFEACRAHLSEMTLDDLYNDTSLVGKLFSEEYRLAPLPNSGFTRALRALSVLSKSNSSRTRMTSNGTMNPDATEDDEGMTLTEAAMASTK